ncbi:asparagine synthase (glutamine-hydrolyzing) [Romboutsia lituseburensis]|uniref:asparagine synthase (glutamine-hydrolyzing) n=1 Tax=Romboutsia lituseburensis TaxID=1537 RepID=UPI00215A5D2A|nr:asparagine synthase (glutamine-hydrolyzing) [Romboutsia lituseburensis]MCR8744957.1 asparagine synthase (glutamine-hydrolyzing) [Romboutsia lituseburensis]
MCGHVSIYYKNRNKNLEIEKLVENINHRGPNHTGIYKKDNIEFAFKRLSILDLENGSQPFEKNNNTIIFNGEIYNHNILRSNLIEKGYEFKTNCDTEVLLTSYIENKEKCVENLRGMFSFIIYDEKRNLLFGARDHFGIKPLYYVDNSDFIAFSSEYKAIVNLLDEINLNEKSLQNYLSFQYVPLENTMIKDIKLIPPGYSFTVKDGKLELKKYYKVDFIPKKNITANDVKEVVVDSIKHHMGAHVEVGTFLSGGIDSTIVATIASHVNPNIKSFSVGFGIQGYDEIEVAKKTARVLGIENIDINVTQQDYIKSLPEVFYHLDDPVADPSQVGIYFLSKEAKKHATVVLSGEGADELFGGYNIYKEYNSVKPILNMPRGIKKALNGVASVMPNIRGKSYLYRATTPLEDRYIGNAKIFENDEVKKIVKNYSENNEYQKILSSIYEEARINNYDYVTTMQHVDVNTWLEGDILQKADKMSMAQSIELRVPFLDKEVLELAKHLKIDQKISNSNTKVLLREAFKDIIPLHMVEKKKLGFPTPIRVWLKEDLGDIVRQTIYDADVDDVLNKNYAISLLDNHIKNHQDNSRKIWSIYAFCLWHQMFIENKIIKY